MQNVTYKLVKESSGNVSIEGHWIASATDFKCFIQNDGEQGNSSHKFELSLNGGQVEFEKESDGGKIIMFGEWERQELRETLELILKHL